MRRPRPGECGRRRDASFVANGAACLSSARPRPNITTAAPSAFKMSSVSFIKFSRSASPACSRNPYLISVISDVNYSLPRYDALFCVYSSASGLLQRHELERESNSGNTSTESIAKPKKRRSLSGRQRAGKTAQSVSLGGRFGAGKHVVQSPARTRITSHDENGRLFPLLPVEITGCSNAKYSPLMTSSCHRAPVPTSTFLSAFSRA